MTLKEKVAEIARHLDGWELGPDEDQSHWREKENLTNGKGAQIHLWRNEDSPRIEVRGHYPGNGYVYRNAPQITVGFKRDAEAIARDIGRRFIPPYLKLYAEEIESKRIAEKAKAGREKAAGTLAKILDEEQKGESVHIFIDLGGDLNAIYGDFTVRNPDGDTDVKLNGVPLKAAKAICRVIAKIQGHRVKKDR